MRAIPVVFSARIAQNGTDICVYSVGAASSLQRVEQSERNFMGEVRREKNTT